MSASRSSGAELPQRTPDLGHHPFVRCLMQVLWPAFLGAAATVGVLFSLVDPLAIDAVHEHLRGSRGAAYTAGFVLLWLLYGGACALTWLLATTERRRRERGGRWG